MATPRPREVGGACRIQVLAAARTQETVGGPNGAKRSEFRRGCPPVGVTQDKCDASKSSSLTHRTGNGASVTRRNPVMPSSFKPRVQIQPFCPRPPSLMLSRTAARARSAQVLRNSPRAMPLFGLPIIVMTALYTSRKQGKLQLACVCGNPEIYVYETKKLTNLFIEADFLNSRCQYPGAKLFLLLCVGFQFVRSCHRDCSSMSRIRFVTHLFPLPISESRRSNCL